MRRHTLRHSPLLRDTERPFGCRDIGKGHIADDRSSDSDTLHLESPDSQSTARPNPTAEARQGLRQSGHHGARTCIQQHRPAWHPLGASPDRSKRTARNDIGGPRRDGVSNGVSILRPQGRKRFFYILGNQFHGTIYRKCPQSLRLWLCFPLIPKSQNLVLPKSHLINPWSPRPISDHTSGRC